MVLPLFVLAQQNNHSEILSAVNQKLDEIWENSKAPGLSLSVVLPEHGAVTFTRGFADVEKQIPMTKVTKMLGGSTGKVFYSVVALQLIEEGKLELDSPIYGMMSDYSWFSEIPNAKKLTVRALMRHESGIPRYVFKETFQQDVIKSVNRIWLPEELLTYILGDQPLFEVGKGFAYSDTNYIILCMLIEKITGESIYELVQTRVLDKAGLKDVVPQTGRVYNHIAQGYNGAGDSFYPGLQFDENGHSRYNLQFEWAGGGLVITSRDLAVLGKKIYEGEMFDPALLPVYFEGRDAKELRGEWGLGVHIMQSPIGVVYGHSGFMPGYITNLMYFPDHQFSMCYQINTSDKERTAILRQLPSVSKVIIKALRD